MILPQSGVTTNDTLGTQWVSHSDGDNPRDANMGRERRIVFDVANGLGFEPARN